ncbi:transposase family Tnp2 protein, partial [Rhizoctonia solani AG-3 Rhs1AP]
MTDKVLSPEDRTKHLESKGCTVIKYISYRDGLEANDTGANPLGFYVDDGAYRIVQMTRDNDVLDAVTQGISSPGQTSRKCDNGKPSEENDGKTFGAVRYFRIFEIGTNRCWRTEKNENVGLVEAASDQPPMSQLYELYRVGDIIEPIIIQSTHSLNVLAKGATAIKKVYMSTNPTTVDDLLRNLSIQAQTESRDQGWASNPEKGQWSWFEIAIFTSRPAEGQEVKPGDIKQYEGKPLTWTSHENRLNPGFQWLDGAKFTWDHPLFRHVEQGNCIVLLACAQFPLWENEIRNGKLLIERIDMNRLQTKQVYLPQLEEKVSNLFHQAVGGLDAFQEDTHSGRISEQPLVKQITPKYPPEDRLRTLADTSWIHVGQQNRVTEHMMKAAREKARKSKKSIQTVLRLDRVVCNSAKCKGRKSHSQATVEEHMLLYPPLSSGSSGESAPQATTSQPRSDLLPMDLDPTDSRALSPTVSDCDYSMAPLDDPASYVYAIAIDRPATEPRQNRVSRVYRSQASEFAPEEPVILPHRVRLRSPSPFLAQSHEACTLRPPSPDTTIDEFLLDNWLDPPRFRSTSPVSSGYDPSGTPLPATPLCHTPEPEEMAQDVDPEENHRFFADLYNNAQLDADDAEDAIFGFGHEDLGREEDINDMGDGLLEGEEGAEENGGDELDMEDSNEDEPARNVPAGLGEPPIQDLDDGEDDPDEEEPPAAFWEHPILRNIYLRTYIDLAFHHATKEQVRNNLLSHKLALDAAARVGELPPGLLDGLLKMPLSVRSLERRLGMDTTRSIRIYTFCEGCGTRYSPEQIRSAPHPRCTYVIGDYECDKPLYTEVILYDGTRKRNPIKSCPYVPLHGSLERLLIRPGMKEIMQVWRGENPENRANDSPPRDRQHWREHRPRNIGDISQAREWWRIPIGLTRDEFSEEDGGGYGDYLPEHLVALVSKLLGLSFSINADGYQTFSNGSYSTMGVYITINNLPFYLRTLIENMLLVIVIPGPNEPTAYEFDQMMEPLIEDLIALTQGVRLNVYDKAEEQPKSEIVYGHLSLGILDHIARLKVCGHAAEGFKLRHNELRDPLDRLDDKYRWLNAPTAAAQEQLRKETGVTYGEVAIAQRLLQRFGRDLTRMNYPTTPNIHTAIHLEEAPFERANRVLINVNNNGHTGGGVEASMARGWLKRAGCHALVREMQAIENPTLDDTATIEMMLSVMRDGPEHERQRGRLDAILAGEDVFQSQAFIRVATTSAEVDWRKDDHRTYWELVADHCSQRLPGTIVYPYGQRPEGGGDRLEIAAWIFEELDEPEVINITRFSGVFALSDIEMSTGHYWLTFAMQPTEPDMLDDEEE